MDSGLPQELPYGLVVRPSGLKGQGMGVWTTRPLPLGLKMGPYEGRITARERMQFITDSTSLWEVHDRFGNVLFTLDGAGSSHWMSYVKYARHDEEKNLLAIQYERNIYYRTGRDIPANTELLVWYSTSYSQALGIPTAAQLAEPDESGVYNCDKCLRSFCYPLSLLAHAKYEACNRNMLWCDDCGKVFAWHFTLRSHIALTHTSHRPYECLQCSAKFTHSSALQLHLRSKHSHTDKTYACPLCRKTFPQSSQLRRHIRTHTGGKPYKCLVCEKCFADSTNLRSHTRIHTGERPFKCSHCSRSFAEGSTLKSHIRTHTGEKPFKCQHCGKAFAHLSSHRKHTLTHARATRDVTMTTRDVTMTTRDVTMTTRHIKVAGNSGRGNSFLRLSEDQENKTEIRLNQSYHGNTASYHGNTASYHGNTPSYTTHDAKCHVQKEVVFVTIAKKVPITLIS